MRYSDELIEEVRSRNDIVDVISAYVKLQKKGSSYFGLCPFHNEKSPSFSVSRQKQMYYCFGCGAGGNVFTFLMEYENYTFLEALRFLAARGGVELPQIEYSREAREQEDKKAALFEVQKEAARFYVYQLGAPSGEIARKYLAERQLSEEMIRHFGLGYAAPYSNSLYKYMKSKQYSDELLMESGLFTADEKRGMLDKFWNRVMFPIMNANNRVIGFGGRVMGDGKPKYLNSPETRLFDKSRNLYGLNFARSSRKGYIILCEGYMDVIAMHQAGFTNAVASLGTALTTLQAGLLKRYTDEIRLLYDSDGAGIKAALRAIPILKETGLPAKVVSLKPYKDPDEFIKACGPEEFEKRLDEAVNSFFFEIRTMEEQVDQKDPEQKTRFHHRIAEKLLEFSDEIQRGNYLDAVCAEYQLDARVMRNLVAKLAISGMPGQDYKKPKSGTQQKKHREEGIITAQKLLLTWLAGDPDLFIQVEKIIQPEDFTEDPYRLVASLLYEQYRAGDVNPAKLLNQFVDSQEQKAVTAIFNEQINLADRAEFAQALKETVLRIKENSIEKALKELDPADIAGLQKVLADKKAWERMKTDPGMLHISPEKG